MTDIQAGTIYGAWGALITSSGGTPVIDYRVWTVYRDCHRQSRRRQEFTHRIRSELFLPPDIVSMHLPQVAAGLYLGGVAVGQLFGNTGVDGRHTEVYQRGESGIRVWLVLRGDERGGLGGRAVG